MNSRSPSSAEDNNASQQPEWHRQLETWRALIDQCTRKPTRKSVHSLRSLTLRLRSALNFGLQETTEQTAAARAFRRWEKKSKKLRKALQPVRDADVQLSRIGDLREELGASTAKESQTGANPRCVREIDKLENRVKRQRNKGIDALMAAMDAHGKRFKDLAKDLQAALPPHMPFNSEAATQAALGIFAGLARDFSHLDHTNLHEFRKRLKQALYLAEISATVNPDPAAKQAAQTFREMHKAAGEWHDWQVLALEAGRIFSDRSEKAGLVAVLDEHAEQALERALALCRRSTKTPAPAPVTSGPVTSDPVQPSQQRKPVDRVMIDGAGEGDRVADGTYGAAEVAKAAEGLINFPRIKGVPGEAVLEWIREGRK